MTDHDDTPATCAVTSLPEGGLEAVVTVPTYSGGMDFTIRVERGGDGDWLVYVPWPDGDDRILTLDNGAEVSNGIAYLGAPDLPCAAQGADACTIHPGESKCRVCES